MHVASRYSEYRVKYCTPTVLLYCMLCTLDYIIMYSTRELYLYFTVSVVHIITYLVMYLEHYCCTYPVCFIGLHSADARFRTVSSYVLAVPRSQCDRIRYSILYRCNKNIGMCVAFCLRLVIDVTIMYCRVGRGLYVFHSSVRGTVAALPGTGQYR